MNSSRKSKIFNLMIKELRKLRLEAAAVFFEGEGRILEKKCRKFQFDQMNF